MVGKDQWNGTFGSSRWNGYKKNRRHEFGGSIDFSNGFTFWDECGFEATSANSSAKAKKIAKIGSRGSFFSLSRSKSHLWVCVLFILIFNLILTKLKLNVIIMRLKLIINEACNFLG